MESVSFPHKTGAFSPRGGWPFGQRPGGTGAAVVETITPKTTSKKHVNRLTDFAALLTISEGDEVVLVRITAAPIEKAALVGLDVVEVAQVEFVAIPLRHFQRARADATALQTVVRDHSGLRNRADGRLS